MKARDVDILNQNREQIIKSLDVGTLVRGLVMEGGFTLQDVDKVLSDARRRQQTFQFLELLQHKSQSCYETFLEVLSEYEPHLYLLLTNWDQAGDEVDDEWMVVRQCRAYLITEIDGWEVMKQLRGKSVFTPEEEERVQGVKDKAKRTEAFLDILETKSGNSAEFFNDAISTTYPHVYLMLTDNDDDDLLGDL